MTLNILFLTVTIKKRNVSAAEYERAEMAKKQYEATRDRMLSIQRLF
ncbi:MULTISPECIES: YrzI family small protein [Robertmurraya]|uniref:YrzI family small protein n=1 Tax=Robertmurraya beringensis TaxID=641660 RepID=A0ABV6KM06_9BACI